MHELPGPPPAPSTELELRVLAGLHAGAALPIGLEDVLLGSDETCDVILLDPEVLPRHLRLRADAGRWLAEPEAAAPVRDRHGAALAAGAPVPLDQPIQLGQTWIVLCAASAPWEEDAVPAAPPAAADAVASAAPAAPPQRWRWALGLLSAFGLLLALTLLLWPDPAPPAPPPAATAPAEADSIEREAVRVLRAHGLAAVVGMVYETGHLTLEAQLDDDETRRFHSAVAMLRSYFGKTVKIDIKLSTLNRSLPFAVSEIVTGPAAHIRLADGTILYPGETAGGYRLLAIRPGKLLFSGKREIELPW